MKKWRLLGLLFFYPIMGVLIHFRTDGFTFQKVLTFLPNKPAWETHSLSSEEKEKISQVLSQKFHYLGSGRQCFVFVSSDQEYVLKLINHQRFVVADWVKQLPMPSFLDLQRLEKIEKRHARIDAFFQSFQIGYENLPEETGILYLQLNKSETPLFVQVSGPGYVHTIPLHKTEFILQRRVNSFYSELKRASHDAVQWKKILSSYVSYLEQRIQKEIVDDDRNVFNLGYAEGRTILIDAGRLYLDPAIQEHSYEEMKKSSKLLQKRLDKSYPEMGKYLFDEIEKRKPALFSSDL
ncbi:MAG TPA: hypothetical protein VLG44_03500 [Chlamydiales bacterium]|nr:hypothetical protein [Chlamydiales bacterium]